MTNKLVSDEINNEAQQNPVIEVKTPRSTNDSNQNNTKQRHRFCKKRKVHFMELNKAAVKDNNELDYRSRSEASKLAYAEKNAKWTIVQQNKIRDMNLDVKALLEENEEIRTLYQSFR